MVVESREAHLLFIIKILDTARSRDRGSLSRLPIVIFPIVCMKEILAVSAWMSAAD